jgi:hypothetical protein
VFFKARFCLFICLFALIGDQLVRVCVCACVLFGRNILSLILEAPPLQGLMIDDENLKLEALQVT